MRADASRKHSAQVQPSSEGVVAASISLEMPPVDQVVLRDLDQDDVQQITDRLDTLVGEVIEHHDTRMD
jgi:hypothetical protein